MEINQVIGKTIKKIDWTTYYASDVLTLVFTDGTKVILTAHEQTVEQGRFSVKLKEEEEILFV